MKKFITDLFTEDDGTSWCLAKVTSFIAVMSFLGNASYSIYAGYPPNLHDFGMGLMEVLTGCGVLIFGKQATQQKEK
jgi:hypothetical protein